MKKIKATEKKGLLENPVGLFKGHRVEVVSADQSKTTIMISKGANCCRIIFTAFAEGDQVGYQVKVFPLFAGGTPYTIGLRDKDLNNRGRKLELFPNCLYDKYELVRDLLEML